MGGQGEHVVDFTLGLSVISFDIDSKTGIDEADFLAWRIYIAVECLRREVEVCASGTGRYDRLKLNKRTCQIRVYYLYSSLNDEEQNDGLK